MPDLATHPAPEGSYDVRPLFDKLKRHLPLQAIEAALKATDSASERERRLPMPSMVLLLLGAALFRHVSLEQLVLLLHLALPTPEALGVTSGAISHARKALGPEPLEQLFQSWAAPQAHAAASVERWRGLSLYGLDGSSLRVADTEPNRDHFGGHDGGPRGRSGYPLVRLVVLMALRSHLLAAAAFGPFSLGEFTLAQALWAQLPADSLIVLDRNFYSAAVLLGIERIGPARGSQEGPEPADPLHRACHQLSDPRLPASEADDIVVGPKVLPSERDDRALPRALGGGAGTG
jgi:hypothetical protein